MWRSVDREEEPEIVGRTTKASSSRLHWALPREIDGSMGRVAFYAQFPITHHEGRLISTGGQRGISGSGHSRLDLTWSRNWVDERVKFKLIAKLWLQESVAIWLLISTRTSAKSGRPCC
jgi:hypothetical protein